MNENLFDQLRATRRLLHEIAQLCEHATLTGSLSGGAPRAIARFNTILAQLTESGAVPENLFSPLSPEADYGEVGVEARMLASYIREGEKERDRQRDVHDPGILVRLAPFVDSKDLSSLIREQMQQGVHLDMHILTSIAPFLGKEDLGMLLREHIQPREDRPGRAGRSERSDRSDRSDRGRPERPERPERPDNRGHGFPPGMGWPFPNTPPSPPAAPTAKLELEEALEKLRNPELSDEERDQLIRQVRELATE